MECNKDEANRAKEIAERKFMAKDIVGAKKFALKAQNLYPGLDGITHMLATLDVYISAENKVNGETDWYGILGVNPQADDEAVRKQYRKLALMLHPDKNKSIGAEGAFKFISEAWSVLSDKSRRGVYDKKNGRGVQRVPTPSGSTSVPPRSNGSYNIPKAATQNVKSQKNNSRATQSSTPAPSHKPKTNTFWTVCHGCKMQYEYLRVYLNHNLLCPNCHQPFHAVETAPPPSSSSKPPMSWNFPQQRQKSNQAGSKSSNHQGRNHAGSGGYDGSHSYNQNHFQWGPFSGNTGASTAAQAATVVQQAYEKVRREREEAQAATKREEALRRKQASKRMASNSSAGNSSSAKKRKGMDAVATNQMGVGTGGASSASLPGSKLGNFETVRVNGITKPYSTRDLSQFEIQNLLMEKARKELQKKLNDWNLADVPKIPGKDEDEGNQQVNQKREKKSLVSDVPDKHKSGESVDAIIKSSPGPLSPAGIDAETLESMSINVPDPDFHDFDKDRTEKAFEVNQVWSAYDNDDGMPRYYAMIHQVISLNPFKIRISWLNSKTNSELGPHNWVGSGFSKTCGDFRIGKHEINNSLNSFSHKVRWIRGARGTVGIYPRKGDVWAIYRNWSPDWNELTADEVIHKYDMVEVLEDYNEELGVTVTPLVKVAGFKTVFHRHLDPREVRRIPREEMFRFSHHVPSYLLTGQEAPNAPKGCRELDPAATPLELLQVITDVKEGEIMENEEKTKEDDTVNEVEKEDDTVNEVEKEDDTVNEVEKVDDTVNEVEKEDDTVNEVEKVDDDEIADNYEGKKEDEENSKDAQGAELVKDAMEIEEDERIELTEQVLVG